LRKNSLREPVKFKTGRWLQSGSKLTRSESGSEFAFGRTVNPAVALLGVIALVKSFPSPPYGGGRYKGLTKGSLDYSWR
jgi:hypothetical protein